MSWRDSPTDSQIRALWHWFSWEMSRAEATDALKWAKTHATRKQVSEELGRLRELSLKHDLNREECFRGELWAGYFNYRKEHPLDK